MMRRFITATLAALTLIPAADARHVLGDAGTAPADTKAAVTRMATEIAGRPVEIRCQTAEAIQAEVGYALAYVILDGRSNVLHIGPTVCGYLAHPDTPLFGAGLFVVVHEAVHIGLNTADESVTNCTAIARLPGLLSRYFGHMNARPLLYEARVLFDRTPDNYRQCP